MLAAAAQDVLVLEIVNITCIKEMWRFVADLEDRCTDLRHSSMHTFVGRSISPTEKGPECITIVRTRNPNLNPIGNYRKGCTATHTNALEMRAKHASNSYKCITRLIVTGTRQYCAALVWSCTIFAHSACTARKTPLRHSYCYVAETQLLRHRGLRWQQKTLNQTWYWSDTTRCGATWSDTVVADTWCCN